MAKRQTQGTDGEAAFRKRQKITHEIPVGEDVSSSDQLRKLLAFDQDLRRSRHGLQSFKKLLDTLISGGDDRSDGLQIIQQYLDAVRPRDSSEDGVYLGDIMEMWSFAAQVHDEGVMSSCAVVLALLLQIISDSLQLVPHGLGICRTLLQERQLKSISRNLSAEKSKGFVISPTLRMLREAVSLDGGAYAKRIFRARDYTFASLGRNLEIGHVGDGAEDPRKTSVRTNAIRFLTTCLKYLHSDGRRELLSQRELLSHMTFMMKTDSPTVVLSILDSLKEHVLLDDKIPRDVKSRCFNTKSLVRFLGLYSYAGKNESSEEHTLVSERAHDLLLCICTRQSAGVLYPSTGLYPKVIDGDESSLRDNDAEASESSPLHSSFANGIPVYNFILSELAQKLKPWSGMKHGELLTAMFQAAPELIADYFFNTRSFTFEPKLTMTWIGYAAFLFNTMMIPIPASFGDRTRYAKIPPPTSILLDNIIPLPINQKVLVKCLSTTSQLTSFFATRILVASLEKLSTALTMLKEGFRATSGVWSEESRRLVDAYCQRVPEMKDVVRSYKSIPAENTLHRTVASRLLRLYYEVIPRVALAANFDVSPLLVECLRALDDTSEGDEKIKNLRVLELENLVSIAGYSPGMRWFSKVDKIVDGASLSPFTALLQLLCTQKSYETSHQLKTVLETVAVENQLVPKTAKLASLLLALRSFSSQKDVKESKHGWQFVDNCVSRCAGSPIKYVDLMETRVRESSVGRGDGSLSLLAFVMEEQLPFATKSASREQTTALARFLSMFLDASILSKENKSLIQTIHDRVRQHLSGESVKLPKLGHAGITETLNGSSPQSDDEDLGPGNKDLKEDAMGASKLQQMLDAPILEGTDNGVSVKWASQTVDDLVEDDWARRLILLLLSEHTQVRKEANINLLKMAAKIKDSSYEEKDQIWLLLSELAESSRAQVDVGPVPSPVVAFAIHALEILRNPLHPLYPKTNNFLTRGPVWSLDKVPLAHDILHGEPSEDDRYYTELTWLLAYLLDGLRTPADLALFHKKRWFEKIFALASNPYLRSNLRTRVLRILYRATMIDSGATTLATRFGIFSWLDVQRAACDADVQDDAAVYEALMRRVWDTCDQVKVSAWSKGGVGRLVQCLPVR